MNDSDEVGVRLRASLKPADYENLTAEVWATIHVAKSTPAKRKAAFTKLRSQLEEELVKEITSVFEAAGYESPFA